MLEWVRQMEQGVGSRDGVGQEIRVGTMGSGLLGGGLRLTVGAQMGESVEFV